MIIITLLSAPIIFIPRCALCAPYPRERLYALLCAHYAPPYPTQPLQMDTPLPGPGGYGQCAPPACNCGTKPCGFYAFNHSSDTIVNGMSFQQWFIHSYVLDSIGSSPDVRAHECVGRVGA